MNIKNSKELNTVTEPWFTYLYARQSELYEKYKHIEGMPEEHPLDIDTKETQIWIKDFFWRVAEELMEAMEAYRKKEDEHFMEELSDALHFYLEIFVLLGIDNINLDDKWLAHKGASYTIDTYFDIRNLNNNGLIEEMFDVVYEMGLAANLLRNKKWKQTQVFVDKKRLRTHLVEGFVDLINVIMKAGARTKHEFLELYYKKYQVNRFRQDSNY